MFGTEELIPGSAPSFPEVRSVPLMTRQPIGSLCEKRLLWNETALA
jgi:hypothetical protein